MSDVGFTSTNGNREFDSRHAACCSEVAEAAESGSDIDTSAASVASIEVAESVEDVELSKNPPSESDSNSISGGVSSRQAPTERIPNRSASEFALRTLSAGEASTAFTDAPVSVGFQKHSGTSSSSSSGSSSSSMATVDDDMEDGVQIQKKNCVSGSSSSSMTEVIEEGEHSQEVGLASGSSSSSIAEGDDATKEEGLLQDPSSGDEAHEAKAVLGLSSESFPEVGVLGLSSESFAEVGAVLAEEEHVDDHEDGIKAQEPMEKAQKTSSASGSSSSSSSDVSEDIEGEQSQELSFASGSPPASVAGVDDAPREHGVLHDPARGDEAHEPMSASGSVSDSFAEVGVGLAEEARADETEDGIKAHEPMGKAQKTSSASGSSSSSSSDVGDDIEEGEQSRELSFASGSPPASVAGVDDAPRGHGVLNDPARGDEAREPMSVSGSFSDSFAEVGVGLSEEARADETEDVIKAQEPMGKVFDVVEDDEGNCSATGQPRSAERARASVPRLPLDELVEQVDCSSCDVVQTDTSYFRPPHPSMDGQAAEAAVELQSLEDFGGDLSEIEKEGSIPSASNCGLAEMHSGENNDAADLCLALAKTSRPEEVESSSRSAREASRDDESDTTWLEPFDLPQPCALAQEMREGYVNQEILDVHVWALSSEYEQVLRASAEHFLISESRHCIVKEDWRELKCDSHNVGRTKADCGLESSMADMIEEIKKSAAKVHSLKGQVSSVGHQFQGLCSVYSKIEQGNPMCKVEETIAARSGDMEASTDPSAKHVVSVASRKSHSDPPEVDFETLSEQYSKLETTLQALQNVHQGLEEDVAVKDFRIQEAETRLRDLQFKASALRSSSMVRHKQVAKRGFRMLHGSVSPLPVNSVALHRDVFRPPQTSRPARSFQRAASSPIRGNSFPLNFNFLQPGQTSMPGRPLKRTASCPITTPRSEVPRQIASSPVRAINVPLHVDFPQPARASMPGRSLKRTASCPITTPRIEVPCDTSDWQRDAEQFIAQSVEIPDLLKLRVETQKLRAQIATTASSPVRANNVPLHVDIPQPARTSMPGRSLKRTASCHITTPRIEVPCDASDWQRDAETFIAQFVNIPDLLKLRVEAQALRAQIATVNRIVL